MLKRLRWKFISSAMTSILAVMLVVLMTINISYYIVSTNDLDSMLLTLTERIETIRQPVPNRGPMPQENDIAPSPREQHSLTFITIHCNSNGDIYEINHSPYLTVSDDEIADVITTIVRRNSSSGYHSGYRYLIQNTAYGLKVSLLGCTIELQNMRNLLLVSCIVSLVSFLAVFGLVSAFSYRAINPYIKNIERQKQFITDASHELKTPITSIAASADVLAVEHKDDEWVQNIQKQSVRLSKLVTNLVTLSRLDEENPFPDKSEFSLSDAVWEISEPFTSLAKAKGKCYNKKIDDDIHITGDKPAIQQMISILLDNAVKYSNPGGSIGLYVFQKNKNAIIQVANTCEYVDANEIGKLFDRFYRPDKSRNKHTGGTGIGLAIAKATAVAHNGNISVSSRDEHSICFTVIL